MTGDRRARSLLLFLIFAMGLGPALLAKPGKVTSLSECVLMHPQKEKADSECGLGSCEAIYALGAATGGGGSGLAEQLTLQPSLEPRLYSA